MEDKRELSDVKLEEVSGGAKANGIEYKYSKGTKLRMDGMEEYIIAEVLDYAVINGCAAYELNGTKYFISSTYTQSMQCTLEESFLDNAGYYVVS